MGHIKVTDMEITFQGCTALQTLDLSSWNTSAVTSMKRTFSECTNLTSVNLSNWNTSLVTNMEYMFYRCNNLTELDLRSFNTSRVTTFDKMFNYCASLEKIYAATSFTTTLASENFDMFYGCTSIDGGAGTTYDGNHTDIEDMHV